MRGDKGIEDDRWKIYQRSGVEIKVPHIADAIQQVSKNVSYQRDFAKAGLPNHLLPELSSFDNLLDKFQKLFPKPATEIKKETEEDGYLANLFNRAKIRRNYSMITSSSGFESSDTYRLIYVFDQGSRPTTHPE